jgi:ABC-type nitrate/sulfonate/bicarbonate transport system ATPase subunit
MRQRLAIARAYAVKPQFLLMDEPFGALDAQSRSAMQDLLLAALTAERKTVMLITHSVDEAIYLSSKIIVVTARPSRIKEVITVPFAWHPSLCRLARAYPCLSDARVRSSTKAVCQWPKYTVLIYLIYRLSEVQHE